MKGQELVNELVMKWVSVVNRVAMCDLGEKMIVCGRVPKWWDEQIKDKNNEKWEKYIRRLFIVWKICEMSIVDYGKK